MSACFIFHFFNSPHFPQHLHEIMSYRHRIECACEHEWIECAIERERKRKKVVKVTLSCALQWQPMLSCHFNHVKFVGRFWKWKELYRRLDNGGIEKTCVWDECTRLWQQIMQRELIKLINRVVINLWKFKFLFLELSGLNFESLNHLWLSTTLLNIHIKIKSLFNDRHKQKLLSLSPNIAVHD